MWHTIEHAVEHTVTLIPILLLMHILIELLERRASGRVAMGKILGGKLAPLYGAAVGVIPQCGFGVVASTLYAKRNIAIGTLFAVFISTSDEALPILLSNPAAYDKILPLILTKFLCAAAIGFLMNLLFARRKTVQPAEPVYYHGCHGHAIGGKEDCGRVHSAEIRTAEQAGVRAGEQTQTGGKGRAAGHTAGTRAVEAVNFLYHPVRHTLTTLLFVFVVNLALGVLMHLVGEDVLRAFMERAAYLQPVLAGIVGLIPNCAASVAITELYIQGHLHLGAAIAGLSCNAGLGLAVLFKANKHLKENIAIVVGLYGVSMLLGYAVMLVQNFVI